MKLMLVVLSCACRLSAVAADYEWSSVSVPLVAPETQTPLSGLTAYLIDADVLGQQQILSSVIGEGQALADYLKGQGGATLANAPVQEGLIDHTAFNPPSEGTDGHAYFVTYSEALQALYFSGYSSITPDGFGRATLVSNASSSADPINYTTIFQGSMTSGDGGGWYAAPEPTGGALLLLGLALLGLKRKES